MAFVILSIYLYVCILMECVRICVLYDMNLLSIETEIVRIEVIQIFRFLFPIAFAIRLHRFFFVISLSFVLCFDDFSCILMRPLTKPLSFRIKLSIFLVYFFCVYQFTYTDDSMNQTRRHTKKKKRRKFLRKNFGCIYRYFSIRFMRVCVGINPTAT